MKTADQISLENAYNDVLFLESWKKTLASAGLAASMMGGMAMGKELSPEQIPLQKIRDYYEDERREGAVEARRKGAIDFLKNIVYAWKNKGYQTLEEVEEGEGKGTIRKIYLQYASSIFPREQQTKGYTMLQRGIALVLNTPSKVFIDAHK
jgi:hypothetical protein